MNKWGNRLLAGTCVRMWAVGAFCACLWCGGIAWPAGTPDAPATDQCAICAGAFTNLTAYVVKDRVRQVKKEICKACSDLKATCWACDVPAHPKTSRKLADGRMLCSLDAQQAVLSETEARALFAEAKRDVLSLLAHWRPRPETNFTVYLVNQDDFIREFRRKPAVDHPEHLLGLTRSERVDTNRFEHFIYLLSGVPKGRFRGVCAHEYTHAWLNEHSSKARVLHADTEEGFCELLAYKYVTAQRLRLEAEEILKSSYTRGQVNTLVAAEQQFGFYSVVTWILHGADSWLDKETPARLLAVSREVSEPEPATSFVVPKPIPTAVPDVLTLKGISGSRAKRFALVNDQTLAQNESAKVRVGTTSVKVKCIEIRDGSVLLQVEGHPEPMELFLTKGVR